ncbi:zinc-binding dehydrogenase [Hymenobacter sp. P5342]|uniref:Zinc-binding dehydrogenase n=2 Tax=Hymenobacter lapidiphilus TaxID=2608003 RepID=A0A7Y7PQN0_9BACT|nr:zinc-binding dehydrogenase [Hymenobacter lapidiphilus]
MQAWVTDPQVSQGIALREVPIPVPGRGQALVAVRAISLNRGEVRDLRQQPAGTILGWDTAGVLLQPAGEFPAGTRVVAFGWRGGWAQYRAVNLNDLAVVPAEVELGVASTLPVAAGTAWRALQACGNVHGRRVLITGAAGGVGRFAVQLARLAGAHVVAQASTSARTAGLETLGAQEVVTTLPANLAPVDAVLECGGDDLLHAAAGLLKPTGLLVHISGSQAQLPTLAPSQYLRFGLGTHLRADLERLLVLVAQGQLDTQIVWRRDWQRFPTAAELLLARHINGKAVLDL